MQRLRKRFLARRQVHFFGGVALGGLACSAKIFYVSGSFLGFQLVDRGRQGGHLAHQILVYFLVNVVGLGASHVTEDERRDNAVCGHGGGDRIRRADEVCGGGCMVDAVNQAILEVLAV